MAKLVLENITSGHAATTLINANNDLVEAAIENTLSLDGTLPNAMQADLDVNSNNVINVADGVSATDAVNVRQLQGITAVATGSIPSQATHANKVLKTDGSVTSWANVQDIPASFTATGGILATTLQTAIAEVDSEKMRKDANLSDLTNFATARTNLDAPGLAANNTFIGSNTFKGSSTTASGITAVGTSALLVNTTGADNTAVGVDALAANTDGGNSTAVGRSALSLNTSGGSNTAVGLNALLNNTTAHNNTAVGRNVLALNTTGQQNTAVGRGSLTANITGSGNIAVGMTALSTNSSGGNNVAVGINALLNNTVASSNVAVGANALYANIDGYTNTAVGTDAGNAITTGSNLTVLGYAASASSASAVNEVTFGNAVVATLRAAVTTITAISDRRDKKDIQDIGLGLAFVQKLKPVKFKWAMRDGAEKPDKFEPGFIAQDFQQVQAEENAEWMGLVYESNPDKLEATPGKLIPVLVKAIQELSAKNIVLETRLAALEAMPY